MAGRQSDRPLVSANALDARCRFGSLLMRRTITRICDAVRSGSLREPFTASDINRTLGIDWAGTFLSKHRLGKPGTDTKLFIRVARGL